MILCVRLARGVDVGVSQLALLLIGRWVDALLGLHCQGEYAAYQLVRPARFMQSRK